MSKSYHKHFRFEFKKKNGRFYVIYRTDPARPRSTGIPMEEGEGCSLARQLGLYKHMYDGEPATTSCMPLGEFARDFFDPELCTWTRRMARKNASPPPSHKR